MKAEETSLLWYLGDLGATPVGVDLLGKPIQVSDLWAGVSGALSLSPSRIARAGVLGKNKLRAYPDALDFLDAFLRQAGLILDIRNVELSAPNNQEDLDLPSWAEFAVSEEPLVDGQIYLQYFLSWVALYLRGTQKKGEMDYHGLLMALELGRYDDADGRLDRDFFQITGHTTGRYTQLNIIAAEILFRPLAETLGAIFSVSFKGADCHSLTIPSALGKLLGSNLRLYLEERRRARLLSLAEARERRRLATTSGARRGALGILHRECRRKSWRDLSLEGEPISFDVWKKMGIRGVLSIGFPGECDNGPGLIGTTGLNWADAVLGEFLSGLGLVAYISGLECKGHPEILRGMNAVSLLFYLTGTLIGDYMRAAHAESDYLFVELIAPWKYTYDGTPACFSDRSEAQTSYNPWRELLNALAAGLGWEIKVIADLRGSPVQDDDLELAGFLGAVLGGLLRHALANPPSSAVVALPGANSYFPIRLLEVSVER